MGRPISACLMTIAEIERRREDRRVDEMRIVDGLMA